MSIVTFPNEFLWVEKYRPKKVDDCVLPKVLKNSFEHIVSKGRITNILLASPRPGSGKTTMALAICEEIGADVLMINGSEEGRSIDTLRNVIKPFAATISLTDAKKVVIIDEADFMNAQSVQPAMRALMEEFSSNCSYIFTCNYKAKIIEAIHSRCTCIDFIVSEEDKPLMASTFFQKATAILDNENIEFDPKAVAKLVTKYFPDYRRTLNELQRYSASGKIDVGILVASSDVNLDSLFVVMKEKNFTAIRKWVGENSGIEPAELFSRIYTQSAKLFEPQSLPGLVLIFAEWDYKSAFMTDKEICIMAALMETIMTVKWK